MDNMGSLHAGNSSAPPSDPNLDESHMFTPALVKEESKTFLQKLDLFKMHVSIGSEIVGRSKAVTQSVELDETHVLTEAQAASRPWAPLPELELVKRHV